MSNCSINGRVSSRRSIGFSLIELLVSMTIALIVLISVTSAFSNSVRASATSLKEIKLSQELRVVMDVMARDIRRAGYWSRADSFSVNPFASGARDVTVVDGSCITYSYDSRNDNVIHHNDNQGFKLVGNAVAIRKTSAKCDDKGGHKWESISDKHTLDITRLDFQLITEACRNLNDIHRTCDLLISNDGTKASGQSGDVIEIMYVIALTLSGRLKGDESVEGSMRQIVSVRNTFHKIIP